MCYTIIPERPPLLDFALLLLDTYMRYPVDNLDNAWFPLNYCMLPMAVDNKSIHAGLEALLHSLC